jgi:dolichyl-phosphate beta-glucosyltransferase
MVDDGSGDGTWAMLEEMRARAPERIITLRLERNRGKAEAVRQGMLKALEDGPSPDEGFHLVGYWDADLSTPLATLPLFMDTFAERPECRLVMGSRVRLLGRRIIRRPLRHYLGRVFSTLASLSLDLPVYDTQCGAKLFRADGDLRDLFSEPFSDPWLFDVEILSRLRALWGVGAENRIVELPLPVWEDVGGSKLRLRDGARAAVSLVLIWLRRMRGKA